MNDELEWWPLKEAAARTGYTPEAIRRWAAGNRVRSRRIWRGKRELIEVVAGDVLRERGLAHRNASPLPVTTHVSEEVAFLRDRVATLEELARRYRHIDGLRDEIAERQVEIAKQHREIEVILQGPSVIPDGRG